MLGAKVTTIIALVSLINPSLKKRGFNPRSIIDVCNYLTFHIYLDYILRIYSDLFLKILVDKSIKNKGLCAEKPYCKLNCVYILLEVFILSLYVFFTSFSSDEATVRSYRRPVSRYLA